MSMWSIDLQNYLEDTYGTSATVPLINRSTGIINAERWEESSESNEPHYFQI